MVRLQKIAYEQIVNSKALGRARKLTTPAKWFTVNPLQHNRRLSWGLFNKTFLKYLRPFYRLWFNWERGYQRDFLLQQGLTFEDKYLHTDVQLRRCPFFEHIARQSLHPYHWVLKARRRERFFRMQRANRGFFVPQYIRSQAKTQTYHDYRRLLTEWWDFTFKNYWSDVTPIARKTHLATFNPLQLALNYGIWRPEAWERYFFTERDQGWFEQKDLKITRDPRRFPYDLTTPEGRKQFQHQVNLLQEKYPGIVTPQGQKFDFKKYYAQIGV